MLRILLLCFFIQTKVWAINKVFWQNNTQDFFHIQIRKQDNNFKNSTKDIELNSLQTKLLTIKFHRPVGHNSQKIVVLDVFTENKELILSVAHKLNRYWISGHSQIGLKTPDQKKYSWFKAKELAKYQFSHNEKHYTLSFLKQHSHLKKRRLFTYAISEVQQDVRICTPPMQDVNLKVLSYNIYGIFTQGSRDIKHRQEDLIKSLRGYDVVILQEAFHKSSRDKIVNQLQVEYPYATPVLTKWSRPYNGGVVLLSRHPIIINKKYIFKACAFPDCFAAKGINYIKILKGKKTYHLAGLHLDNEGGWSKQKKQILEARNFFNRLNIPKEEPLIIGGDFNVDFYSTPERFNFILNQLNLQEPNRVGHHFSIDPILNLRAKGLSNSTNSSQQRQLVDYIFLRQIPQYPVKQYDNSVVISRSNSDKNFGHWEHSDHYRVEGTFSF